MTTKLFNEWFVSSYIDDCRLKLTEEIKKLNITDSKDVSSTIEMLKKEFTINPIEFKNEEYSKPRETTREKKDDFGMSYSQDIYEIIVKIPFDGDKNLFYCKPQTSIIVHLPKNATINSNFITITIIQEELDKEKAKLEVENVKNLLSKNLPNVHSEIGSWNSNLDKFIEKSIKERKEKIDKINNFMK